MKFAFLFPGQGSQSLNMMSGFSDFSSIVNDIFNQASEILKVDLLKLINGNYQDAINNTTITQPLVLTASVATLRVYQYLNNKNPVVLAGHSLGEYTALVASGSLEFSDAVSLVSKRAQLMQDAVPQGEGLMAAILGLNQIQVIDICKEASNFGIVSAANFNAPEQIVIAGEKLAVEEAMKISKAKGAKRVLVLSVSVPSHCKLMYCAANEFKSILNEINLKVPAIDIINNVDVQVVKKVNLIKDALVRQLYSPVCWTQTINKIYADGISNMVECNPSNVIRGLVKRINSKINCISFNKVADINNFVNDLNKE